MNLGGHRSRLRRWPQLLAASAVAAPVVGQVLRMMHDQWRVTSDDAVIAVRAHDVLSRHPPLVGLSTTLTSSAKAVAREQAYHLGPALFEALALPERLFGRAYGLAIGAALVQVCAIAALLWWVHRLGGDRALLVATTIVLATTWSVGHVVLADPWNPFVSLWPFGLALVSAAAVALGRLDALPWFVAAASFAVQTHFLYAPPLLAVGLLVVAAVVVHSRPPEHHPLRLRWAVAILVAMWSLPILDQLTHDPGNFSALWTDLRAASVTRIAPAAAARLLGHTIGGTPLWLRGPLDGVGLAALGTRIDAVGVVIAGLAFGAVLAATIRALRRGRREVALLLGMGLALVGGAWYTLHAYPADFFVVTRYRSLFLWIVSAAWWSVVAYAVHGWWHDRRPAVPSRASLAPAIASGTMVAASVLATFGASMPALGTPIGFAASRRVPPVLASQLDHRQVYELRAGSGAALDAYTGIYRELAARGFAVRVPAGDAQLGHIHETQKAEHPQILLVQTDDGDPVRAGRRLARIDIRDARTRRRTAAEGARLRAELAGTAVRLRPQGRAALDGPAPGLSRADRALLRAIASGDGLGLEPTHELFDLMVFGDVEPHGRDLVTRLGRYLATSVELRRQVLSVYLLPAE